jgi:DeoR family fructose operon transcriptional repressor
MNTRATITKGSSIAYEERKKYVLEMLDRNGSVSVSDLSNYFGISEVSVRKLLTNLERERLLLRRWGGAVRPTRTLNELPYQTREITYLPEKIAIASHAYNTIEEGDSIYLDSGTTTFELAKLIRSGPTTRLLVATNALDHARELLNNENIHVILVGGELHADSRACSGYLTRDTIGQMVFDKGFIGIEHISIEHGITTPNMRQAELKRAIIQTSKKSIVLADYSKFWNDSLIQIAPAEKMYSVITDWRMTENEIRQYKIHDISVVTAQPVSIIG